MTTINGKVCVVDGVAVDKVFSNGKQVYGRNLLLNSRGKFQPCTSKTDNYLIYDFDGVSVYMVQGQQYTVHANASSGLVWTGIHYTTVETNNVLLWLTDITSFFTVISDATTGTGTTFTWNRPSGTYYLRVNTYKSDNSGYVENVKLEQGDTATPWTPAPEDVM